MDYVQNKNVSMINEQKRAISEKKEPKDNQKIICIATMTGTLSKRCDGRTDDRPKEVFLELLGRS